jgi:hypothetical protein
MPASAGGQHTQKYQKLTESHRVVDYYRTETYVGLQQQPSGDEVDRAASLQSRDQGRAASLPPPLPDRQGRGQRQSEPALFPSMPRVEVLGFEVQRPYSNQVPYWLMLFFFYICFPHMLRRFFFFFRKVKF